MGNILEATPVRSFNNTIKHWVWILGGPVWSQGLDLIPVVPFQLRIFYDPIGNSRDFLRKKTMKEWNAFLWWPQMKIPSDSTECLSFALNRDPMRRSVWSTLSTQCPAASLVTLTWGHACWCTPYLFPYCSPMDQLLCFQTLIPTSSQSILCLVSSLHHYACMRVYLYRGFYQLT